MKRRMFPGMAAKIRTVIASGGIRPMRASAASAVVGALNVDFSSFDDTNSDLRAMLSRGGSRRGNGFRLVANTAVELSP